MIEVAITEKIYTFAEIIPVPDCPNNKGWYLRLEPGDIETFEQLHRSVAHALFNKFVMDPHRKVDVEKMLDSDLHPQYNIPKLGAGWCATVMKLQMSHGAVWMNPNGGMFPDAPPIKIVRTVKSGTLVWPHEDTGERITIRQWQDGVHYHLSSNIDRLFVPVKYDTFGEAWDMALAFAPKERITVEKPQKHARREGD